MRIDTLDLRAFGPFTDVTVDLSAGAEGLHLVYGPNEAGKTSTLRAIEQALFGIPPRSSDDFVHPYGNLRIGATLRRRDGARLTFLRRKGAKNTLLEADGLTPLDEAALLPFLEGVDRDTFATMFGIDHAQLVRGGGEIVHGSGQVGQVLFAAGAGIADLQSVQEQLRQQAEALFAPRGTQRPINQLLRNLQDARKRQKESLLSSDDWVQHDQALQNARAVRDQVETDLHQAQREAARLDRMRQAQPLLARRREAIAQRAALGTVTRLRPDFAEQRRTLSSTLQVAAARHQAAGDELQRIDEQLAAIHLPEALLAQRAELEGLREAKGSYRKAQADLPALRLKHEHLQTDATARLRELRPGLSLEMVDTVRLTKAQQAALAELSAHYEAYVQAQDQAQADVEEARRQSAAAEAELAELVVPGDPAALRDAVRRALAQGDLEQARAATEAQRVRLAGQAQRQLQRLPFWSGTLDDLEQLPVPALETIQRFDDELAAALQRMQQLEEKAAAAAAAWADNQRLLDESRLTGEVPTEVDLIEARRLRDQGWRLVLDTWQGHPIDPRGQTEFRTAFPAAADLPAAYQQAVAAADLCADRLRREATRVAQQAGLVATQNSLLRERAALDEALAAARRQQADALARWQSAWTLSGPPGTPREMRAWLEQQRQLLQLAEDLRRQQSTLAELDQRIERHRAEVVCCQRELIAVAPPPGPALARLLGDAQALIDRVEKTQTAREQLQKSLRQLAAQRTAAEGRAAKAGADLRQWQERWAEAVQPLGLRPASTPAEANAVVGQFGELFARLQDAQGIAERIAGIENDARQFRTQVQRLAAAIDPALATADVETAAEELARRVQRAADDQRQQQRLAQDRKRKAGEHEAAQGQITEAAARLKALCEEAGCADAAELPELERRSQQAAEFDRTRTEAEEQLLPLAGGGSIDDLAAEAEAVNADELPGQLDQWQQRAQALDHRRRELSEQIGREEEALKAMRASTVAAEAGQDVQDLLARLEADAQEYARLRLAAAVLRGGIERYRRKNEGPVLRRASELFRRLTLDRFERLSADTNDEGQQVLKGVRAGGATALELAAMSEGTADQLYLALRLASLEQALERREPFPFIVDDILISFDNQRAAAALAALADLATQTQVIFFTHHEHLLELASEIVGSDRLWVHRLDACRM